MNEEDLDNYEENELGVRLTQRPIDPTSNKSEVTSESALRPETLDEFIGQPKIKEQMSTILQASVIRKESPTHMLFSGPPGLGKTTLAMIISHQLNKPLRITSGPAIQHSADLAAILSSMEEGEVLFIDEIHRMNKAAEELLYSAMEDFRVDIVVGKGIGASAIPLTLSPFTVVGATTRAGLLSAPLRDRFGFIAHIDFYENEEIEQVILRSAKLIGIDIDKKAVRQLAMRSRGTPRIANRLLRWVRDWSQVNNNGIVDERATNETLNLYEVDSLGLDKLDLSVLRAIVENFDGGPVGLKSLVASLGVELDTVEDMVEPYLVRESLVLRTPQGRVATQKAFSHLGIKNPNNNTLF